MATTRRGRKPADDGRKKKRTICLSVAASTRLDVHAVGTGQDVSAVVEALIMTHCRRFSLVDRGDTQAPCPAQGEARVA